MNEERECRDGVRMRSKLVARALFGEAFKMGFEKVCVISVLLALLDFSV